MKNKNFIGRLRCLLFLMALASFNYLSAQTGPNDDFDGDGIINSIDIDDDNDGVLDDIECPPQPFFYNFNWQVTGGTTAANIQPGNRMVSTNVFQINGQSYDAYFELISKNSGTGGATTGLTLSSSGGAINLVGIPNLQHYIVYDIFFVKNGDPVTNVVTFGQMNVNINDIDNASGSSNFTDVGAFVTTPYTGFSFGSRLQLMSSYGSISNAYGLLTSLQSTDNDDPSSRDSRNIISAKFTQQPKYRMIHGLAGSNSGSIPSRGIVLGVQVLDKYCDNDGDGVPNHFDLDSDGDGCPDAVEAGTAAKAGAGNTSTGTLVNTSGTQTGVANARVGSGGTTGYGANGFYDGIETVAESNLYSGAYTYWYATNAIYNLCIDTDVDGIPNLIDIDDDNDGIPDATESPACYYTIAEAAVISKVSTGMTSNVNSVAVTTGADIPTMRDGVSTSVTASNHNIISGQTNVLNAIIYNIEYPTAINLASLTVVGSGTWGTGSAAVLEGSQDNVSFTTISAPLATTAASKTWTVIAPGTTTAYRYYRIRMSTAATAVAAVNNYEVTSVTGALSYIQSAHPKPTACVDANIDGDNIPPHLDLDTDGDGCSDALEGGATSSLTSNFKFTGPVGANGLDNTLETGDNGVINYTSTYHAYAESSSIAVCRDTDGDGILDIVDVDDDNDGVLDTLEQVEIPCFSASQICSNWIAPPATATTTAPAYITTDDGELVSYTVTTNAVNTITANPMYDPAQCGYGDIYPAGNVNWQYVGAGNLNNTVTFNFNLSSIKKTMLTDLF